MLVGEDEDNTRSLQRETSEISSHLNEFPKNIHILVVDNNFNTLLDMKKIMRRYAYQATVETDAETALAFLTSCEHDINIVVWDFHMPGINGIQALNDIGSKMDIPVVIMSDDGQRDSLVEAIINGACDYITKPVTEEIIVNMWQHIVRKRMLSEKKKMMSKPQAPVQSDLAQSNGLDKGKAVSMTVDQEQDIERKEMKKGKRTQTTWTEVNQPDLVHTNELYQHSDGSTTIYQANGEEEKAAKIPQITTWAEDIQLVQADLVQTNGLGQENDEGLNFINQENDELNIEKKERRVQRKDRMTWGAELHQKFLEAIELLGGIRRASPKSIHECLQQMNVKGLTRANVGSHLQKHRLNLDENRIPKHSQFGLSTAYRSSTRRFQRSNKALFRNHSNNFQTASSSFLTNARAVNPIQQNQYQNGYLPMNNQLSPFPFVHHRLQHHQPQQQQYQSSSHQFNYVMNNEEPGQASGTYVGHSLHRHQHQPQQPQYQLASHLFNYVVGNEELDQAPNTYVDHLLHQHQPQQQQYQSASHLFNYVLGNEEPGQAPNTYVDHLIHQHQPQQQQYQSASNQLNYVVGNEEPEQASGTYVGHSFHQNQQQPQQYQSSHQFNYVKSNEEPGQASGTYVDLLHQNQKQPQQYQSSHQFDYVKRNEEPGQASGTYVDLLHQNQKQPQQYQSSHQFEYVKRNEEPGQASCTYVDLLHQNQKQQQQYQSSHQFDYVMSNEEPEQASGVTGLEPTYPSVPLPQQYQSPHQFDYVMTVSE